MINCLLISCSYKKNDVIKSQIPWMYILNCSNDNEVQKYSCLGEVNKSEPPDFSQTIHKTEPTWPDKTRSIPSATFYIWLPVEDIHR